VGTVTMKYLHVIEMVARIPLKEDLESIVRTMAINTFVQRIVFLKNMKYPLRHV
jgi:hypothetical protein